MNGLYKLFTDRFRWLLLIPVLLLITSCTPGSGRKSGGIVLKGSPVPVTPVTASTTPSDIAEDDDVDDDDRDVVSDIKIPEIKPALGGGNLKNLPKTANNPVDGAELILIPAGEFVMGAKKSDKKARRNEFPQHKVYLDSYYIYKYEVTTGMFKEFIKATGYESKSNWSRYDRPEYMNHPVMNTNFIDAAAYCRWAGVTLPTEAQWEKAARGESGRIYPWGNEWDPNKCNNLKTNDPNLMKKMISVKGGTGSGPGGNPEEKGHGSMPVGSVPADVSPYGVFDMGGNINEWCYDWYDADYYKNSPKKNPVGPDTGKEKSTKGGGWSLTPDRSRASSRWSGSVDSRLDDYGFRCAASPEDVMEMLKSKSK